MLVLALFFQLFATFERIYRRKAPSLRAAITTHVHRQRRLYVPLVYLVVLAGGGAYVADAPGVGGWLGALRQAIGPTSAYLFGGTLLFMTFVLFPARAGQEKIPVPTLARAALLLSLGVSLVMVAMWHDAHPKRTALAVLPWMNLHSIAFAIFLAFLRYEFAFLHRLLLCVQSAPLRGSRVRSLRLEPEPHRRSVGGGGFGPMAGKRGGPLGRSHALRPRRRSRGFAPPLRRASGQLHHPSCIGGGNLAGSG
jgi:hypothetical protein